MMLVFRDISRHLENGLLLRAVHKDCRPKERRERKGIHGFVFCVLKESGKISILNRTRKKHILSEKYIELLKYFEYNDVHKWGVV